MIAIDDARAAADLLLRHRADETRLALTWRLNELSGIGVGIGAGQCVITGTGVTPEDVVPGDRVQASYGGLGELPVRFD